MVLSFQTADVERDLAALRKLQQRTCSQLGDESTDQRARIQLCGPEPAKERGLRASGFVASIAKAWAAQVVRRANSSAGKRLGEQGAVPQRARKRLAGSNRQVLTEDPTGEPSEKVVDGESCHLRPYKAVCLSLNSGISRPGAIEDQKMSVCAVQMPFRINEVSKSQAPVKYVLWSMSVRQGFVTL